LNTEGWRGGRSDITGMLIKAATPTLAAIPAANFLGKLRWSKDLIKLFKLMFAFPHIATGLELIAF
jgi:hypothetical protein